MVCAGAMPSLREASCWSVEVVKGGCGWRLAGFASTELTAKEAISRSRRKASASSPLPMSSRVIFLPSAPTSRALKTPPSFVASVATSDQYSRGTKLSISRSRSQTRRNDTDCTRPAEREPGSLRQSTGERVKPTR